MHISHSGHHLHSAPSQWVGLTGFAGSGKSTLGRHLVSEHGFTEVNFADPIREASTQLDPLIDTNDTEGQMSLFGHERLSVLVNEFGWDEAKRRFPDLRRFLQRFGTDAIRSLDPDFWVRQAVRRAASIEGPVVFCDVRFDNEVLAIRNRGGIIARVERPGYGPVNDHISETALTNDRPELVVLNIGDVDELTEHASTVALITSQIGVS